MSEKLSCVIVGAGHRGLLYASYALEHPDELAVVGVADPSEQRRKAAAEMFGFSQEHCYESAEALAGAGKIAVSQSMEPWIISMSRLRSRCSKPVTTCFSRSR